jgi:ferredoxin
MSLLITGECINCGACLPECPNEAIFENRSEAEGKGLYVSENNGKDVYVISADRCTECVGHFDQPQCAAVCPVPDCCVPDPKHPEAKDALFNKAKKIHPDKALDPNLGWAGVRS